MAGSEPFPLLNTANDQHSSSRDANGSAARRRRKSSGLGAELRGDNGAPSLGTSFAHMNAASGQQIRVSKRLRSSTPRERLLRTTRPSKAGLETR